METGCRIELFGGLRVTVGQETVTRFPTQKAGLLLAHLALAPGKLHSREQLIGWLWPELESDAGRNNLSTLLSLLRRALEPRGTATGFILQADRQAVTLNAANVQTDVAEFDVLLRAAQTAVVEMRCQYWQQAACLIKGELLPDCYEEWALQARTLYAEQYGRILRERAALLLDLGRYVEAERDAAQALQANACDEAACQLRMRCLSALGRADAMLQAYARLETALAAQLETTPNVEMRALKDRLRSESGKPLTPELLPVEKSVQVASIDPLPIASPPKSGSLVAIAVSPSAISSVSASAAPVSSRLPAPLTRFFGREREQEALERLLRDPDTRLVTLLGAGGAGKTRLALEMARQFALRYAGRVWFVALADIPDPALMPMRLLTTLQLPMPIGDPLQAICDALADAPTLLVLDNMEHLLWAGGPEGETKADNSLKVGGQALIRRLLETLPRLTCLATSRQALHLEGEQEYALPPLALPGRKGEKEKRRRGEEEKGTEQSAIGNRQSPHLSSLLSYSSVALYVDRAQKAKADFVLTAHNADAVAALCRKLEGMPLAIEMAAAWIKTVPPARMLERLEHQLEMLVSRRRDLPARQQSLRATCEWSYGLLSPELQQAFRRLSVFRGGWTMEAAEAIWKKEEKKRKKEESIEGGATSTINYQLSSINSLPLHFLAELQARSLILVTETEDAEPRYRLLEPLREFGMEKVEAAGESDKVRRLHARYFAELAANAKHCFHGPEERSSLERLKQEQDNLRAALAWLRENDGWQGLRLAAGLSRYWELSGLLAEGRQWLGDMLALPEAQEPTEERACALRGAGGLALLQADYQAAEGLYAEALTIFRALHNQKGQADAMQGMGNIAFYQQEYERARACYEQSLEMRVASGEERGIAASCHSLGNLEMRQENYASARAYMERALRLRRKGNDAVGITHTLGAMGQLARLRENYAEALALACEILPTFYQQGIIWSVALCLRNIAEVLWHQGKRRQVVFLIGAAQALRDATGFPIPPAERATHEEQLAELRGDLGHVEYERIWAQGYALNAEQAVIYVREQIQLPK